jgi:hypothetical protein
MVAFYKHDIPAWMDGTERLSDGAYRAYHIICQLIYLHEGPITLNERGIAGRCNQRLDRFRRYLAELVDAGKLRIVDGKIDNGRAESELARINSNRNGISRGHRGRVEAHTRTIEGDKPLESLEAKPSDLPLDKTREEKSPPTPPPGVVGDDWNEFEKKWGTSDTKAPGVRELFRGLDPPDRRAAIAGVDGFRAEEKTLKRGALGARRYLAERRWLPPDLASAPRLTITPSWPNWTPWRDHYAETNQNFLLKRMRRVEEGGWANENAVQVDADWPPGYAPSEAEQAALTVCKTDAMPKRMIA